MDLCHVLLDRPWQDGCRTVHDGYKNTFTFHKDNVKVVFDPTCENLLTKPNHKGCVSCLFLAQFMEYAIETVKVYVVVGKEVS